VTDGERTAPLATGRLAAVVLAALAVYLGLHYLEPQVSMPLRRYSTIVAHAFLVLFDLDATRHGTVLITDRYTFDVVPACSGSTTLRVLMALGLLASFLSTRLAGWRRVLLAASTVPLALVANGLRVAILVVLGDIHLVSVDEGPAHILIGLCTFALALGGFLGMHELLADGEPGRRRSRSIAAPWGSLAVVLALVLAMPVATWTVNAWISSPLDAWGWVFVLVGFLATAVCLRRLPAVPAEGRGRGALVLAATGALLILLGAWVSVHVIQAGGALALLAGLTWTLVGRHATLAVLPLIGVVALGLPTTTWVLNRILGIEAGSTGIWLKIPLSIAFLALAGWGSRRAIAHGRSAVPPETRAGIAAVLGVALIATTWLHVGGDGEDRRELRLTYLQGAWRGEDVPVGEGVAAILGRERVTSRIYRRGGDGVHVVITATGGDRHRAHPPSYCLTGAGYRIVGRETIAVQGPGEVPLQRFRGENGELAMVSWFTDGDAVLPAYADLLWTDAARRLAGARTDWHCFRLISPDEAALRDFLEVFDYRIGPRDSALSD